MSKILKSSDYVVSHRQEGVHEKGKHIVTAQYHSVDIVVFYIRNSVAIVHMEWWIWANQLFRILI